MILNTLYILNINNADLTILINTFSYVNYILVIIILMSLSFTFYKNGSVIHKILGLLLLSIFVVFLWILQTQFLFIYIVYILAFISAVLMLFLSVVLMLPISLPKKITKYKYNNIVFIFSILVYNDIYIIQKLIIINFLLFVLLIHTYLKFKNLNICIINFKTIYNLFSLNFNIIYLTSRQIVNKIYQFIVFYLYTILEIVIQSILYCIIFILITLPFTFKQTLFNITDIDFDISLGLGNIKVLLYGDLNAFLIFSTIILLISLFGASIMTKSYK